MTPHLALKLAVTTLAVPLLYLGAEAPGGAPTLVPSAQALIGLPFTPLSFAGVARRTTRRVYAVEATSVAAAAGAQQTALAQQQAATAQQQAATAQQQQAVAQQQATVAAQQSGVRPALGTVVQTLPGGCTASPRGGVEYYDCGGVFYRAAFQGSNLVYVVQNP